MDVTHNVENSPEIVVPSMTAAGSLDILMWGRISEEVLAGGASADILPSICAPADECDLSCIAEWDVIPHGRRSSGLEHGLVHSSSCKALDAQLGF